MNVLCVYISTYVVQGCVQSHKRVCRYYLPNWPVAPRQAFSCDHLRVYRSHLVLQAALGVRNDAPVAKSLDEHDGELNL